MRAVPQRPSFVPHPLAVLAAAYALGVLVARFVVVPRGLLLCVTAVCSIAALYSVCRRIQTLTSWLLVLAFFLTGATLATVTQVVAKSERLQRLYEEALIGSAEPVEVTGVLDRGPEPAPDGLYLTLKLESVRFKDQDRDVSGYVSLFAPTRDIGVREEYELLELRYGARLRVMTALDRTEQFRNPGVSTLTEYLERKDLDATGIIKSPLLVERLDDVRVFLPLAWLYEWRQNLIAEIDQKFSPETAGVLKAAFLGNRYQLSRAAAERFREAGTFHVLVISGMHITFMGGFIFFLMGRLTDSRLAQFIVAIVVLWAYTFAVGAEVSVVRAAVMFTIVALAPVVFRRASSLNALGGATLGLLIWRPDDLFDPSFQLTFLSVLAIIVLAWPLLQRLRDVGEWHPSRERPYPPSCHRRLRVISETLFWSERGWQAEIARSNFRYRLFKTQLALKLESLHLQRALRYAASAMVVSLSVQITLLPILIIYFHRVSISSLVLNIVVGILMALLALSALAALLLSPLSTWLASPFLKLAEALNWLMIHSVDPFSSFGIASVRLPEYTGWPSFIYLLYYLPLGALAILLARWDPFSRMPVAEEESRTAVRRKAKVVAAALIILLAVIVTHPLSEGRPDGRLRFDFLDVGQGDSILVTMPDGTTLLVDGGGKPGLGAARAKANSGPASEPFQRDSRSIGEAVVSEYLWWRGLDHVDYILATHADADHIDGLNDVVRNFRVRAGIVGRAPWSDPEYAQFTTTANDNNVPLYLVGRGDVLRFGNVNVEVLWPQRALDETAPSRNNDSIVLRLRFGDRCVLLTGDIEKESEATLSRLESAMHCDVVKAAHHGSRTSSIESFVNATKPAHTVISVGLTSIFGHPHKEVVDRWRGSGAEVLTTGNNGTITFSTDGKDLRLRTFVTK